MLNAANRAVRKPPQVVKYRPFYAWLGFHEFAVAVRFAATDKLGQGGLFEPLETLVNNRHFALLQLRDGAAEEQLELWVRVDIRLLPGNRHGHLQARRLRCPRRAANQLARVPCDVKARFRRARRCECESPRRRG